LNILSSNSIQTFGENFQAELRIKCVRQKHDKYLTKYVPPILGKIITYDNKINNCSFANNSTLFDEYKL
jgi:hypothetical protein